MSRNMNKARRHELKMLKFNKRLKNQSNSRVNLLNTEVKAVQYSLRSHSTPCSCSLCRSEKYSRKVKHKNLEV